MVETRFGGAYLFLRGKAASPKPAALLNILRDILLTPASDNRDASSKMPSRKRPDWSTAWSRRGHRVVDHRCAPAFADALDCREISGVSQSSSSWRQLLEVIEHDWAAVLSKLQEVHRHLVNRSIGLANVTFDAANWATFRPHLESFLGGLPAATITPAAWQPQDVSRFEGLTIPAQVNYVGKGAPLYRLGYRLHGSGW